MHYKPHKQTLTRTRSISQTRERIRAGRGVHQRFLYVPIEPCQMIHPAGERLGIQQRPIMVPHQFLHHRRIPHHFHGLSHQWRVIQDVTDLGVPLQISTIDCTQWPSDKNHTIPQWSAALGDLNASSIGWLRAIAAAAASTGSPTSIASYRDSTWVAVAVVAACRRNCRRSSCLYRWWDVWVCVYRFFVCLLPRSPAKSIGWLKILDDALAGWDWVTGTGPVKV